MEKIRADYAFMTPAVEAARQHTASAHGKPSEPRALHLEARQPDGGAQPAAWGSPRQAPIGGQVANRMLRASLALIEAR